MHYGEDALDNTVVGWDLAQEALAQEHKDCYVQSYFQRDAADAVTFVQRSWGEAPAWVREAAARQIAPDPEVSPTASTTQRTPP